MFKSREGITVYPDALAPGTEVGTWRVVERLGVGGYGAVYRAQDTARPNDFYSLKVALRLDDGRAEREMVLVMTRAAHPNVVRFHGCFRWPHPRDGFLCIVMDWVPGLALHTWAELEGSTFLRLAEVGGKVALTLDTLHERGVLHRDLKPEHILIREPDGEPVLLDFGAGWYEGAPALTHSTLPPGTAHLRSPEAVRFLWKHHRHPEVHYRFQRTDELYTLGVCLYRAATGHYPFPPETMPDLLQYAIVHQQPPEPSDFNRRVPRALSDLIMRLLAKKPEDRYQRGAEVQEALVAAVAFGEPKRWRASIFEWEEVAPEKEGEAPQRRIRRPQKPTLSMTPPPPRLVIPPPLPRLPPLPRGEHEQAHVQPTPESKPSDERRRMALGGSNSWAGLLAVALGLLLLLGAKWLNLGPFASTRRPPPVASSPTPPTRELLHGQEVAPSSPPPDIERAAAPPPMETTPVVVASPVTRPKDNALKKQTPSPQGNKKQKGMPSPMSRWLLGAAAAAHTACQTAQVRPATPKAEPCPAGAVETMTQQLGIPIMHRGGAAIFPGGDISHRHVPVKEGAFSIELQADWDVRTANRSRRTVLPRGTLLSGQLCFGEKHVYGRITQVATPNGDSFTVCMELTEPGVERGLKIRSDGGEVRVNAFPDVRAVDHFQ
jgi:eukaryotic-like serine/threonine-protein kinase